MRTDPFTARRLPIWLLISFISLMLLLAWLLGFHYPFLCRSILSEWLLKASSSCWVVYAWLICGPLVLPSTHCSVCTLRVDKVTYMQMIEIFISKGEFFKTLSAGIYLGHGILRPNGRRAQSRPKFCPLCLLSWCEGGPERAPKKKREHLLWLTKLKEGHSLC